LPLLERKARLQELIDDTPRVRYVDYIEAEGEAIYQLLSRSIAHLV
jgi:ATP-dependent DNA ligase